MDAVAVVVLVLVVDLIVIAVGATLLLRRRDRHANASLRESRSRPTACRSRGESVRHTLMRANPFAPGFDPLEPAHSSTNGA